MVRQTASIFEVPGPVTIAPVPLITSEKQGISHTTADDDEVVKKCRC